MTTDLAVALAHPAGEQSEIEEWSAIADTFGGRVHVEWGAAEPVTPLGQLPFFVEYLKQGGLFDGGGGLPAVVHQSECAAQARRARHAAAVGSRRSSALCAHHGAAL